MNTRDSIALKSFQARTGHLKAFRKCIMDARVEGDTLVVLCGCNRDLTAVKLALGNHWHGDIELHRPKDLMTGSHLQSAGHMPCKK